MAEREILEDKVSRSRRMPPAAVEGIRGGRNGDSSLSLHLSFKDDEGFLRPAGKPAMTIHERREMTITFVVTCTRSLFRMAGKGEEKHEEDGELVEKGGWFRSN